MENLNKHKLVFWFFTAWVLLNLIQAYGSELIADEAYYWVYAQHLDWGYFEQPPATAFLIWLGTQVLDNELGLRLFFVLLSAIGLWAIWKLTSPKDPILFFTLLLSIVIVHVGGFLAVPDIPLIFTSGIFYLLYKSYLAEDKWSTAIALGITVAALSYSKYHAVVLLMSALAGAWWLLKRPSFWLVPLIATILYLPHIFWQVANDYPPLQYHLIDRQAEPWTPMFALNYLLGQLLVFGPLIGFLLFPAAWKYQAKDQLGKSLRWCAFGILGFFLLLSLKGRVEANWTATALAPLLYLAYHYIVERPNWRKWVFRLAIPSLVLVCLFRLYMLFDFVPNSWMPRNEFHGWPAWAQTIKQAAGDRPVIFCNTYQQTSRYWYYARQQAHSLSLVTYAGDQYDLLTANEESLQGQPAMIINSWFPGEDTLHFPQSPPLKYRMTDAYYSFNRLRLSLPEREYRFSADTLVELSVTLSNPTDQTIRFDAVKEGELSLKSYVFHFRKLIHYDEALKQLPITQLKPGEKIELKLPLRTPKEVGEYRFRYSIGWDLYSGRNGNFTKVRVE